MLDESVAERYAGALFEVSEACGKTDLWDKKLSQIAKSVENTPFLSKFLKYPFGSASEKKDIMKKVFGTFIDVQIMNFIFIIIDRGRASYLDLISKKYSECIKQSRGIVSAEVISAAPLSPSERARLARVLTQKEGRKVEPSFSCDPSLIGGVVIKMGGRVIDGSLSRALSIMKEKFANVDVSAVAGA